jgi:hypothetical protein
MVGTLDLDNAADARGRRTGRRVAQSVILGVAVAFIGSSAWQLIEAVFPAAPAAASPGAPTDSAGRTCAEGVRRLAGALDRAREGATSSGGLMLPAEPTTEELWRAPSPEWDTASAVQRACTATSAGRDAWAALERLRSAQEQLAREGSAVLRPLRRELGAHLTPDLR